MTVSFFAALFAGALSFLSPCVLPLVPPYLCFITGTSLDDLSSPAQGSRARAFTAAILFVLGFTTVFVLLGATASAAGALLRAHLDLLGKVAGVAIIIMGLHFLGLFRLGLLNRELRYHGGKAGGLIGAYVIGLAFAFGWTPCIGPVLAAILSLAASEQDVAKGAGLLAVYSLGLGIPFLITSLAINQFFGAAKRIRRYYHAIEVASGALLIVIGLLIITGQMTIITRYLQPYLPTF